MKKLLDIRRFGFFIWAALGFLALGALSNYTQHRDSFVGRVLDDAWRLPYITLANYIFFEYSFPQLGWRRPGRAALLLSCHIFAWSFGLFLWRQLGLAVGVFTPFPSAAMKNSEAVAAQMSYSVGATLFFGILWHFYNHAKLKRAAQQFLIEKQRAELSFLKSQTNPHFLFNTLNNIYSLARDRSDRAPESILRLSKMLRYMLYETSGAYVAIEQELKIIGDYIALEQLRYDDSLRIGFSHDVEDMHQSLPPLLLMPLIENAFKHGAAEARDRAFVEIHLTVNRRQLSLVVRNSAEAAPTAQRPAERIGLSNLRRQLELLFGDYSLSTGQEGSVFTASLKINLTSHDQDKVHRDRG